jgi:GWxTD domain-containing protein
MNLLAQLVEHPLIHALGWSLLHFCWQGTLVAILLASVLGLLSRRSPQLRYAVSCVALAMMVALPVLTFARLASEAQRVDKSIVTLTTDSSTAANVHAGLGGRTEPWLDRMENQLDRSLPWVTAAWFAGFILLLCRLQIGVLVTRRMRSYATQPAPADLRNLLDDLMQRLGIAQAVQLVQSAMVQVPTVIGWLRPVILLPVGCMAGISPLQVEAVIAHELAHIRRHDYLVNVLQSVLEALLFYHPAVWWVSKQVRNEREHCCDDLAVRVCGDSLAYAKALSFLEERRLTGPAMALGANGGVLAMRIRRLLGSKEVPAISQTAAITLLAITLCAVGFTIASVARAQAAAGQTQTKESDTNSSALKDAYRQWVDQDVRWIIMPEERAAFLGLTNDDERDEFIKQFWVRRNPTPDSPENKFREEHYRRIAYANVHFAAGMAGWMSDRGRIYIVNGKPDSIDSHPAGGLGEAKPFEVWHYNSIRENGPPVRTISGLQEQVIVRKDVDMKFVDQCNCGNYQLQTTPTP